MSSEFVPSRHIRSDHLVVQKLSNAVAEFITRLEREAISEEVSEQLAKVLRSEQHLLACADQALEVACKQADVEVVTDEKLIQGIAHYRAEAVSLMKMANPEEASFSFAECELQLDRMQLAYEDVKAALLEAGAELRVPIPAMIDILEQNSRIRRMLRQMFKAMHYLSQLSMIAEVRSPESELVIDSNYVQEKIEATETKQDEVKTG
ncbi:MAG: hypothetical protein QNL62_14180 [Gammaproteobacteria bacterium]|nr:hypothetical protein [Gammaproteobacteria bacterium]